MLNYCRSAYSNQNGGPQLPIPTVGFRNMATRYTKQSPNPANPLSIFVTPTPRATSTLTQPHAQRPAASVKNPLTGPQSGENAAQQRSTEPVRRSPTQYNVPLWLAAIGGPLLWRHAQQRGA